MSKSYVQRYEDNGQVMSTSDTGRWVTYRQYDDLREQNRVLWEALDTIARGTEDRVPPYRCIDFAMARRIAQAALTATSQEGQG